MNLTALTGRVTRAPQRDEMVPLQERAAFLEAVRATFACAVIGVAWLLPALAGSHRWSLTVASVSYLVVGATPQMLSRSGKRRVLVALQASLLLDGVFVAWVMLMTGGTESPFRLFIYAHIVAVTLAASYRTGLKIALWHTLLYLLLYQAAVGGFLPGGAHALADGATTGSAAGPIIFFRVCGFWLVAFATAGFSALNERELRAQKIDLQQLSEWVAEVDHLTSTDEIAETLLGRLRDAFGFERGVVLASPKDTLSLIGSIGSVDVAPLESGLDDLMERAWATRETVAIAGLDPKADPRLATLMPGARNVLAIPLIAERGYRLGFVVLEHPGGNRIKRWVLTLIGQFASHAAMALHGSWLMETIQGQLTEIRDLKDQVLAQNLSLEGRVAEQTEELRAMVAELQQVDGHRRALLGHLVTAQEEERERIAGDVHDDPVQRIIALNMRLQLLRRALKEPDQLETVDHLLESVQSCIHSMRHLLFELRPPTLDEQGLGAAIREYLQERDPDFTYRIEDLLTSTPPGDSAIVAYRIAQEALANVYKHAHATEVAVTITEQDGGVLVQIQDDGVGFQGEVPRVSERGHMGISSMRERAEMQGGWCEISSLPGGGATVRFWIPRANDGASVPNDDGPSEAFPDAAAIAV